MKNLKIIITIVITLIITLTITLTITGCTSADTVGHNISRESDEFKVKRRITFINLRTGDYLFSMTGLCSIQGGSNSLNEELEVICKTGEDKYQKHLLYLAQETTYVVEQLDFSEVSRYDYEFIFRPEAIVPVEIKTEVGGK